MSDLPTTLADLSAPDLSAYLANQGHDIEVASVAARPMEGFVGAMGEVGYFDVTYSTDTELPPTFVGKCPLDDDMAKMYNAVMNSYHREHGFYRDLASDVPMLIASSYVNEFDPETGRALLLLEKVDGVDGDITEGCSVDTMRRLLVDLAAMHGQFWMSDKVSELSWRMDWRTPSFELGIPIIQEHTTAFHAARPDYCPADLHTLMMETWVTDTITWLEKAKDRPWTFAHMDYELDNVVFGPDGEPVILDWQSGLQTYPGVDVAWLYSSAETPDLVDAEDELLGAYLDALAASGGPAWTLDQLKDDMCFGMMYHITGVAATLNQIPPEVPVDMRPRARFEKFLSGAVNAALRWDMGERVAAMR